MDDDDDDFDELDDFEEAIGSCGLMPDGTCMNAGTEWCDFECPYRDI